MNSNPRDPEMRKGCSTYSKKSKKVQRPEKSAGKGRWSEMQSDSGKPAESVAKTSDFILNRKTSLWRILIKEVR